MALTEQVVLDIQSAQRQIDALERQLDQLGTPVNVPVNVTGENSLDGVRQELARSENAAEGLNRELRGTDDELRRAERAADDTGDAMLRVGTRGVSAFSNLRGSIAGVAAGFIAFQGARAFLDFAGDAVSAASDLEESTSKAQVVFGDFFDDIQTFSSDAPQALGLANAAALEFSGTFGNLFVALGLSQEAAADLAPEIVQLGADLASFNNLEVTEALDKLRAGLVGEAEPLRVLGVNLTAASTAAKAVELGLAASTNEVSEAAKVQARYALILEQTTTAQGDFARTADGIANRQRTLNAEFENFRSEVGQALLPAFEALLSVTPQILSTLQGLVPVIADLAASFAANVDDIEAFLNAVGDIPNVIGGVGDVISEGGEGLAQFGTGFVSLFSGDVEAAFGRFRQGFEDFGQLLGNLDVRRIREDLLDLLQAGENPLRVLASGLIELGEATDDVETFRQEAERFFAITGVEGGNAARVFALLKESAVEFGLTATDLATLETIMRDLLGVTGEIPPPLGEVVDGLSTLGADAQSAAEGVGASAVAFEDFSEALEGIDLSDFEQQIGDLDSLFSALPSGLDAAKAALRDDENEIIDDFDTFLSNLEDQLATQAAFNQNIEILERLGLGDLAAVFAAEGLESADALAEAVADPAAARRAEDLLDQQAEDQAQSYRQAFIRALEAEDFSANVRIKLLIDEFDIDTSVGSQTDVVNGQPTGGGNDGARVQVIQNFDNTPSANTETEKAAQQINALINTE